MLPLVVLPAAQHVTDNGRFDWAPIAVPAQVPDPLGTNALAWTGTWTTDYEGFPLVVIASLRLDLHAT